MCYKYSECALEGRIFYTLEVEKAHVLEGEMECDGRRTECLREGSVLEEAIKFHGVNSEC